MSAGQIQLSFDRRVGNRIVNCCIAIALVSTWGVEEWPKFLTWFIAVIVFASVVSLITLATIFLREMPAQDRNLLNAREVVHHAGKAFADPVASEYLDVLTKWQDHLLKESMGYDNYLRVVSSRLSADRDLTFLAAYSTWLQPVRRMKTPAHYKFEPPTKNYSVTIGAVRIDVSEDETKVIVEGTKKVVLQTPKTTPALEDAGKESGDATVLH